MKLSMSSSITGFGTVVLLALTLAGCGKAPPPAPLTVIPGANGVGQVVEYGCPIGSAAEMQQIFRGYYGVDALRRPLNPQGIPVDPDGNCLSTEPVPQSFAYEVSPIYAGILLSRYNYVYAYQPTYVHVYHGPRTVIVSGVPTGRVTLVTTTPPTARVTVAPGASNVVRPGAPAAGAAVVSPAGNSLVVRPGVPAAAAPAPAAAAPAAVAPASVTPQKADPTTPSVFSRAPASITQPAAAPVAPPASITQPRAAPAAPTVFSRPAAPTFSAPAYRPAPSGKR